MDEVRYKLVIEMNYENLDDRVPEVESNNIVIKNRFIISYYQFTYEKIQRIIIRPLAMNVTRNFNLFPVKEEVLDHYSPQMIPSQKN